MNKILLLSFCFLNFPLIFFSQDYLIKGKKDTLVIEFDDNNKLIIPDMRASEYSDVNPSEDMYVSFSDLAKKKLIEFELSMWAIDGDILGNELIFECPKDFKVNSVKFKVSRALYFNEDGSGGVWSASGEYFSEWKSLEEIDYQIYSTPNYDEIEYPLIPDEARKKAETEKKENPYLYIYEYTGSVIIKIDYQINSKKLSKEFLFYYGYGD